MTHRDHGNRLHFDCHLDLTSPPHTIQRQHTARAIVALRDADTEDKPQHTRFGAGHGSQEDVRGAEAAPRA